ncbi:hypothetical protein GCM10020367_36250 [Streptomyces sannanensis]|uniref:DUF2637 domain-containing protein n=1 Tax=Streptomyces sannanensis TaxID=285536 RepID=A0ABP6SDY3_9ACTN
MAAMQLTRTHRILIGVVVAGAVIIAAIGFAGSYTAVRELAEKKGFGTFSLVFPIGIDAGICVLLALDLLLTWIRIPFPLLRQTAWLLTAATIAFNGAAAWPDPLGVGMHAVIPVLFVVSVEAARHAVGRIADITADKHMEGVRLTRWLLSPIPTFLLWRRMKLWELRSYEQVIKLEQDRLIYQSRLQARFGRAWRRKAPVEALMPLRLARYGVPLAETAAAGLAAAGIEPVLLPPAPERAAEPVAAVTAAAVEAEQPVALPSAPAEAHEVHQAHEVHEAHRAPAPEPGPVPMPAQGPVPMPAQGPVPHESPWFAAPAVGQAEYRGSYDPAYAEDVETARVMVPSGPGRSRPLGGVPRQRNAEPEAQKYPQPHPKAAADPEPEPEPEPETVSAAVLPEGVSLDDAYIAAFHKYVSEHGAYPNARKFGLYLMDHYGITGETGGPVSESTLRPYLAGLREQYESEQLDPEQIA